MPRKLIPPPPMSENPLERLEEVKKFKHLLASEFYDYDYKDVYDSVFRARVDAILEGVILNPELMTEEEKEDLTEERCKQSLEIYKIGKHIQETNSTSVKLYIAFFAAIETFFE